MKNGLHASRGAVQGAHRPRTAARLGSTALATVLAVGVGGGPQRHEPGFQGQVR